MNEDETVDSIKDKIINLIMPRRSRPKGKKIEDPTVTDPFERLENAVKRDLERKRKQAEHRSS